MVKINIRLKLNDKYQSIIDSINGKPADIALAISHTFIVIGVVVSIYNFIMLSLNPISKPINPNVLAFLIMLCLITLYTSQLGEYFKKPSRKIVQYSWLVTALSIFSLSYLSITFNSIFVEVLGKIKNIDIIPPDMLLGNIRVITMLVPLAIILPVLYISLSTLRDKRSKEQIREFEFESLLPTYHKFDDTTIDIEVGKNFKTGLPLIVPEKILYEHFWLQGASGAGKSSNMILPMIEQLLKKKSYLNYKLKGIAINCLESGIAYINKPISNEYFNENFSMSLIEPTPGKEEEFYKAFEGYSQGVIKNDKVIIEKSIQWTGAEIIEGLKSEDYLYECVIEVKNSNTVIDKIKFNITKNNEDQTIDNPYLNIVTSKLAIDSNSINSNNNKINLNLIEGTNEIAIDITPKDEGKKNDYNFKLSVYLKGNGRLVPKNLGMTVVAPDGELINTTVKMATDYGIKVHKIDPDMSELRKGTIAKFNPLRGDSPEKIGDIVASILVSMDAGDSNKSNPYFTNASVRAIRNLVILLKLVFPKFKKIEPTLEDVLYYLNNMNSVSELLAEMTYSQHRQHRTIKDYFEVNFIDKDGYEKVPVNYEKNSAVGSQKKETQRALGGIINQLDNLLAREEIRSILCDDNDSINLTEVLRNGECIAISTRQGNLGARLGKAFALFFILSLQNEVLSRYAENENPEIPHFLIIDEFPMYCNESTETFFSFARKYKCAVTIAIQNMGQLKKVSDEFGETIFTNTSTKILMSKSNLEDRKYWSEYFGTTTDMELMTGISTSSIFADDPSYSEQVRGTVSEIKKVTEEDVDNIKFKEMMYSYINAKGRKTVGKGTTDFVKVSPEPYMNEIFNFEEYSMTKDQYLDIQNRKKDRINKRKTNKDTSVDASKYTVVKDDTIINEEIPKKETIDPKDMSYKIINHNSINELKLITKTKEEKEAKENKPDIGKKETEEEETVSKNEKVNAQNFNKVKTLTFKTIETEKTE